ncbi:MAG TPA: hypothetical protein PK874_02700 [Desulfobacteraceae bacterium]|nr:hypothetical protein [Desulfobacteraceae bacterium]
MPVLDIIYNNKTTKNKEVSRNRQYIERIMYSKSTCQALLSFINNQHIEQRRFFHEL